MKHSNNFRYAPPKASAMIEALRGLGYSTATALADIIDNSITANANNVYIEFKWRNHDSLITIKDDGYGMDDNLLDRSMRLGEINPTEYRHKTDLGRFGLGLKTASFSQCRCLTVASKKKNGLISCLRWDLDVLASSIDDGWRMLEGPAEGSEELLVSLEGSQSGTLVIWQRLDKIITSKFCEQNFLDLIDGIERHLAMVFHQYLEGSDPRLHIYINGRSIIPWNPFLTNHPVTWTSPLVVHPTDAGNIMIQCHVLPHKDRLNQKEYDCAAGLNGWTAQQGFYVYRNQRMLLAGSWLGLGQGRSWTKEEAYRLARIKLDIPNAADTDWKIDIRKSTAKPPVSIRSVLTRLAEDTRSRARRVFAHRSKIIRRAGSKDVVQAWYVEHFPGGTRYRIDRSHEAVCAVLDEAGLLKDQILAMLQILEETIPVQRIWLDTTEGKDTPCTGFSGQEQKAVQDVLSTIFKNLVLKKGMSTKLAKEKLLHTEPFQDYQDLVAGLPNIIDNVDEE